MQDGGAVLGFSYHDLMARLRTRGPDDAWARLRGILAWFREVLAEGGYREYYRDPERGTLQGGGPPGGLGMDCEFVESILVPQVMLYGFLGFRPEVDAFTLDPRLPGEWPELRLNRIHLQDAVLDVTVAPRTIRIAAQRTGDRLPAFVVPPGEWECRYRDEQGGTVGQVANLSHQAEDRVPLLVPGSAALELTRR